MVWCSSGNAVCHPWLTSYALGGDDCRCALHPPSNMKAKIKAMTNRPRFCNSFDIATEVQILLLRKLCNEFIMILTLIKDRNGNGALPSKQLSMSLNTFTITPASELRYHSRNAPVRGERSPAPAPRRSSLPATSAPTLSTKRRAQTRWERHQ